MLFNSIYYGVFLALVVAGYWVVPYRWRYPLLLIASYLFYMTAIPPYLLLIGGLTAVNYGFGWWLARHRRREWLVLAVGANLAVLAYFKYTNFLLDTGKALGWDFPTTHILLPLGISFFVFEFIHYVVDVWRGGVPVRSFVQFALFAAFFPTQIAGPIKRYQAFVHQLQAPPPFDLALAAGGLHLILRGLFKKVVLADGLARIANLGFDQPAHLGTGDAWVAVYAFAFQIFFDFSGYTDIGRGSAQLLGFTVPENFAAPYLARNLAEFWRRWHMSLSAWLRDYLYIPLGGSRGGRGATYRNLVLTMTIGGLWHGAAWHFVAWGAYQGAGLAGLRLLNARGARLRPGAPGTSAGPGRPRLTRLRAGLGTGLALALTFQVTCLGWVLFRAGNLADIRTLLGRLLWPVLTRPIFSPGDRWMVLVVVLGYFVLVGGAHWLRAVLPPAHWSRLLGWEWRLRPIYYAVMVAWMIVFPAVSQRFLYFQF